MPLKKNPKSKTVGMLLLLSESDRIQEFTSSKVQTVYAESYTLKDVQETEKKKKKLAFLNCIAW